MNKRQQQRLFHLADFLETEVPARRFNLNYYATGDLTHDCGTVGCALGWAAVRFPRSIKLDIGAGQDCDVTDASGAIGPEAVAEQFFGVVEWTHYDYLFMPEFYPATLRRRRHVAARLRWYAERRGDLEAINPADFQRRLIPRERKQ